MAECDDEDAWTMFKLEREVEVEVEITVANAAKSRLMQSAVLATVNVLDLAAILLSSADASLHNFNVGNSTSLTRSQLRASPLTDWEE
jgi:hypothetical protein